MQHNISAARLAESLKNVADPKKMGQLNPEDVTGWSKTASQTLAKEPDVTKGIV